MSLQRGIIVDTDRLERGPPRAAPIGIVKPELLQDRAAWLRRVSNFDKLSEGARRRAMGRPPLPPFNPNAAKMSVERFKPVVRPPLPPPTLGPAPDPMPYASVQAASIYDRFTAAHRRMEARSKVIAIIEICRETFNLPAGVIEGAKRDYPYARARRAVIALCLRLPGLSVKNIGKLLQRDHTTILHAMWRHNHDLDLAFRRPESPRLLQRLYVHPSRRIVRTGKAEIYAALFMAAERRAEDAGLVPEVETPLVNGEPVRPGETFLVPSTTAQPQVGV